MAAAAAVLALTAGAAAAAPIVLVSKSDVSRVRGDLVSFDGVSYVISTALGQISVDASTVDCEGDGCPQGLKQEHDLMIAGSDTIGETLMPLLVEGLASRRGAWFDQRTDPSAGLTLLDLTEPGGEEPLTIAVAAKGSSTGFNALLKGDAALAMSSRPVKASEVDALLNAGVADLRNPENEMIVGVDSLVVIVSPENPIRQLRMNQIARIFAGEITNWSEVGGPNLDITVYSRDPNSGTRGVFEEKVMGVIRRPIRSDARIYESNELLSDSVVEDPSAIGFTSLAYQQDANALSIETACGIVADANAFAIKTEEYPLERRLFIYADAANLPKPAAELVAFASTEDADGIIAKAGFVDLGVNMQDEAAQNARMVAALSNAPGGIELRVARDMMVKLQGARRLSTTFRFAPGSSEMDVKARRDLERFVNYLRRSGNGPREVVVAGFTDDRGAFSANLNLSVSRATQIAQTLSLAAAEAGITNVTFRPEGFGELAPVGCNEDFGGRRINRRVEVWVR